MTFLKFEVITELRGVRGISPAGGGIRLWLNRRTAVGFAGVANRMTA
jgi:hypothetical protein